MNAYLGPSFKRKGYIVGAVRWQNEVQVGCGPLGTYLGR